MDMMLKLLEKNARMPMEELAAGLGISVQEAARRMDDYQRQGVIRGYRAVIDWEKAGREYVTALIELRVSPQKNSGFDDVAREILRFPEVDNLYLMSGGFDLGLTVHGKSFQEIAYFVSERLAPMDNVLSTATHFVLRRYKDAGIACVDGCADERLEPGRDER